MSASNISLTAQANHITESMILCIKIWSYCLFIFGYGTASFVTPIRMLQISYQIDIFTYSNLSNCIVYFCY